MRYLALIAALSLASASYAQESSGEEEKIIKTHGITYFGEPELPADFKHLAYVNPDAPKGGELSQHAIGTYDSYNPYTHRGRAGAPSVLMFESLMESVANEYLASYCLVCETLEYPESRDWVIFNLRPEAEFSDGSPLTAEDVKFSFETLLEKGFSSYAQALKSYVSKVDILGPHRIKYTFTPEAPRRDAIGLMGNMTIFSKKNFEEQNIDLTKPTKTPFIGSGPYVFESHDFGRSVTFRRNPDYWGKDLPINQGRHNFDRLRFEYFDDYDAAFEAFKAGIYTFRNETSEQHWATRYNFPAFEKGYVVKEEIPNSIIASGNSWIFNLRREKFQDVRVREAIGLMFNFEWSNDTLFYGMNTRLNSFWDNTDLKASGTPSKEELALLKPIADILPEGVLTEKPVMQPLSGDRQLDRRNMRKAAALLDEAGWKTGDDGMRRNAEGQLLTIEFLNYNPSYNRFINPFIENLRAVGVNAKLTNVDASEYTTRTRSHDFDIIIEELGGAYIFAGGMEQAYGSEDADDVFNPMGLRNPAVDALLEKGQAAKTIEENNVVIKALDRVMRALHFQIPQWYKPYDTVAYYDMYEHPEELPPYAIGVTDFWWYDQAKAEKLREAGALR